MEFKMQDKHINKAETDSSMKKTNCWLPKQGGVGGQVKLVNIKRYRLPVMT